MAPGALARCVQRGVSCPAGEMVERILARVQEFGAGELSDDLTLLIARAARYTEGLNPARALVLFDIDGTLIRKAGGHHRAALEDAVYRVSGLRVSTADVPVAGMLDRDIITAMMRAHGASARRIREDMPAIAAAAQRLYVRRCPDLRGKVCPGVRPLLRRLHRSGAVLGLVTGNLSRIGWKKMERSGLRDAFSLGAFSEMARDRAGLVRIAMREARRLGLASPGARVSLIGDHANDIRAARLSGVQAIAVATGVLSLAELAAHSPDLLVPDLRALPIEAVTGA